MKRYGMTLDDVLATLAEKSGLLGLSGVSGDVRDLETAAASGNARAKLALDVFVSGIRQYIGACLVELGGVDVLVFTGGIGENGANIRAAVCEGWQGLGIVLDAALNRMASGERRISADASATQIWIVPTNEELIVARQTKELLNASGEVAATAL
jgi:acetate kinase